MPSPKFIFKSIVVPVMLAFHLSSLGMIVSHKFAASQKFKRQPDLAKIARHEVFHQSLCHKKMAEKPVLLLKNEPENKPFDSFSKEVKIHQSQETVVVKRPFYHFFTEDDKEWIATHPNVHAGYLRYAEEHKEENPEALDFFSQIERKNQRWNRDNVPFLFFPPEAWEFVIDRGITKKSDLRSNLRLVCQDFLENICDPETDRLKVYRALSALCENDQSSLDAMKTQKVHLAPFKWVSYFPVGRRMTLKNDPQDLKKKNKLYTSWEEMKSLCGFSDPYIDHQGKHMLETAGKKSTIDFRPTIQGTTAHLIVGRKESGEKIVSGSFFDKRFRLVAACILGDCQVAQSLLMDCVNGKDKDIILPTAAIAIKNNDVKMLSVFCEALQNAKHPHEFYDTHKLLLNLALAQNKEAAFDALSTFLLPGKPASRIIPCAGRIVMQKRYGEIVESKITGKEKTQLMQDFLGVSDEMVKREGSPWRIFHFYTSNTTLANIDDMSYADYLSSMTNYIDVDRRGRGWKDQHKIFQLQDRDVLEKTINIPMQEAIKNNDLAHIEKTICLIDEEMQYQLNQQNKAALLAMHIQWLKLAKQLKQQDAFYAMHAFQPSWIGYIEEWLTPKISDWAHARDTMDYSRTTTLEMLYDGVDALKKYCWP